MMMIKIFAGLALLGAALVLSTTIGWAETASSLSKVPSLLKTPESKKAFEEQIEGKPAPDALGLHLPDALSQKTITSLLLPPDNKAPLNAVGAKPLPGQANLYIAIVCTGGDIPSGPDDPRCARSGDAKVPLRATLGVIEAKPDTAPKLTAKPLIVDGRVNWRDTQLPSAPDALDDSKDGTIDPDQFAGFDLAPYRIAPGIQALGLRGSWTDSYSGGMGSYTALYLFAVIDGALKRVLAVPMSAYKDIAGDWHKNGTRSHDITDAANVLIVSPHTTDGYFDLLLKSRKGRHWRLYQWSTVSETYQAGGGK